MANETIAKLKDNLMKKGEKFEISPDTEIIGVYFSAHWCPPCRGFTPVLTEFYNKWTEAGKKLEIIFVSSDRDQESFNEYYKEMPWAALNFDCREIKETVGDANGIRGIPTLLIFDKSGNLIEANGRAKIMTSQQNGEYPF